MKGYVAFGEIMLRLTPAVTGGKLSMAPKFSVGYAGAESNVAVSLACLGNQVDFVTKVPDNPIGNAALMSLKQFGVSTENVVVGGKRMGTYFIELGSSIRPSKVIYDRENSAISQVKSGEFDWKSILKDKKWLHLSGITPALSPQCATETIWAARTAKEMGVKVSFDLNFRRTLWQDRKEAREIFNAIMESSDTIFANLGALADVYGLEFSGENKIEQTKVAMKAASNLCGVNHMVFTIREHHSASQNKLQGMLWSKGKVITSKPYSVQIEDRFGTGDAFAAAYLHAIGNGWKVDTCIEFATAAFALKHTLKGDLHTSTEQEIRSIMDGNLSGHVMR